MRKPTLKSKTPISNKIWERSHKDKRNQVAILGQGLIDMEKQLNEATSIVSDFCFSREHAKTLNKALEFLEKGLEDQS